MFPHGLILNTQSPACGTILKTVQALRDRTRPLMGRPLKMRHEPGTPSTLHHDCHPGNQASASYSLCLRWNECPTLPSPPRQRSPKTKPRNSPFLPSAFLPGVSVVSDRKVASTQPREGRFTPPCSSAQAARLRSTAGELVVLVTWQKVALSHPGPLAWGPLLPDWR